MSVLDDVGIGDDDGDNDGDNDIDADIEKSFEILSKSGKRKG